MKCWRWQDSFPSNNCDREHLPAFLDHCPHSRCLVPSPKYVEYWTAPSPHRERPPASQRPPRQPPGESNCTWTVPSHLTWGSPAAAPWSPPVGHHHTLAQPASSFPGLGVMGGDSGRIDNPSRMATAVLLSLQKHRSPQKCCWQASELSSVICIYHPKPGLRPHLLLPPVTRATWAWSA